MKRHCIMKRSCAVLMLIALFSSSLLLAQDEDEAPIAKLKQARVSTIEPGLPDTAFEQWFEGVAGSNATVHYEVNDCGERAGNADERGKTFPLCVEARAEAGNSLALVLTLTVGTFVAEPNAKPDLKNPTQFFSGAIVKNDDKVISDIKTLSAAPAAWKAKTTHPSKK